MFYFVFTTFTVLLIVTQHALEQQKGVLLLINNSHPRIIMHCHALNSFIVILISMKIII